MSEKIKVFLLSTLLCLPMFLSDNAKAESVFGTCVAVSSGDELTVMEEGNKSRVIKLFAIESPKTSCNENDVTELNNCTEKSHPFGKYSKISLMNMVLGKKINVEILPGRVRNRDIGTVWVGNVNANLEQVRRGMAWMYPKYAIMQMLKDDMNEMELAQNTARGNGLGLWSEPNSASPWNYRRLD